MAVEFLTLHSYLSSIYSSLPEFLEKKRLIDMHTNVATAILEQIKVTPTEISALLFIKIVFFLFAG